MMYIYAKYVSAETSPNLVRLALKNISLFGSSYCCERLFSIMKNVKVKSISLRSDEDLSCVLRTAIPRVGADIHVDGLCKQRQCQTSHQIWISTRHIEKIPNLHTVRTFDYFI